MDGIVKNTTTPSTGPNTPANVDAPRVAQSGTTIEGAVSSILPADQSVQAAGKVEKDASVKESALARVEKALSEAFGENFANLRLEVEKHEDSGRYVYKAVNKESGRVERQFPSEDMLKILSNFEGRDGKFLDDTA